jgi:serine phosphatase RsbU (regulator of sigma subunit)/PAS domain-containing protein
LFVLALVAALLLVVPELLSAALGHPAGLADYAELAWLTSSLATVGGALGAGLETDEAVRQAAYSHRDGVHAATVRDMVGGMSTRDDAGLGEAESPRHRLQASWRAAPNGACSRLPSGTGSSASAARSEGAVGQPAPRRLSAQEFEALFSALPTPYVVLDLDLVILASNLAFTATTGRSSDVLVGRGLFDAFPSTPEALDEQGRIRTEMLLRRVADTGQAESSPVYRHDIAGPDGELLERHWLVTAAPVLDADGRTRLLVQRVEDVTEFVSVRERGRLAEERGEHWQARVQQVEADLFARTQALTAALAARESAAQQAAALADVALALVAAESVEEVESELFARGLSALGADGGALVTAGPDKTWRLAVNAALGEQVQATYGVLPFDSPLPAIWTARTQQRLLLPTKRSGLEFLEQMAQVYEDTQRYGWAFLPLQVSGRALGCLAVAWEDEHDFAPAELDLLQGFAAQCAQAVLRIETSQRERREVGAVRRLAEELQHALLTPPPEPDHLHVVVRYQAAATAAEVGGDWYDAFQQPDGATMLVIGDVVGHDGPAAASMGQLRGVLRTLAYDADGTAHDTCAAILTRTEQTAVGLAVDTLATVVLARIERIPDEPVTGARQLRWSNAGHLPPLLLAPDGSTRVLDEGPADLMLGVDPSTERTESTVELPVEHTLLLFTDGLVERRGASLDEGLAALRAALADLGTASLDELCDTLLSRLVGDTEDDVALVAVRGFPEDRPRPPEAGPNRTAANQSDG